MNMFQNAIPDNVKTQAAQLDANSKFAAKLIRDLEQILNVYVESKRVAQDKIEYIVYSTDQRGRYGWGSTFTVTSECVEFRDNRGTHRVRQALEWLGMSKEEISENGKVPDYSDFSCSPYSNMRASYPFQWSIMEKLGKKYGMSFDTGDSYGSSGFRISMKLTPDDNRLSAKLKNIVKLLMDHGITTK